MARSTRPFLLVLTFRTLGQLDTALDAAPTVTRRTGARYDGYGFACIARRPDIFFSVTGVAQALRVARTFNRMRLRPSRLALEATH